MAGRRSTQLIIIGVSVFVIGAGLVYIGLQKDEKPVTAAAPAPAATQPTPGTVVAQSNNVTSVPIVVPKNMIGVTVKLEHVAGLAGYAKPGSLIDVYATVKGGKKTNGLEPPYAKLVLSGVHVLDVKGADPAAGTGDPIYMLALTPKQAERLIFFAKFESLWAALVPTDAPEAKTPGRDYKTVL